MIGMQTKASAIAHHRNDGNLPVRWAGRSWSLIIMQPLLEQGHCGIQLLTSVGVILLVYISPIGLLLTWEDHSRVT